MNRRKLLSAALAAATATLTTALPARAPPAIAGGEGAPASAAGFARRRRFVASPFGRIAYVESGRGPAALFLHGFPLNGFQWRDALELLAPHRRCIAPDFLGMGYTQVAAGVDLAPATQVRMLLALLDALAVGKADVIASDSGGAVAQLLLAAHPERLRSLLLSNCDSEIECPPQAMMPVIGLARQGRYAREWLVPWWKDPAKARGTGGIGGMCYATPASPTDEAVSTYFAPLVETPARLALTDRFAVALSGSPLSGVGPGLGASTIPVGLVWGMADTIFSTRGLAHLAGAFGNLRQVKRLEGGRLFWPEERPGVIREQALKLWSGG